MPDSKSAGGARLDDSDDKDKSPTGLDYLAALTNIAKGYGDYRIASKQPSAPQVIERYDRGSQVNPAPASTGAPVSHGFGTAELVAASFVVFSMFAVLLVVVNKK